MNWADALAAAKSQTFDTALVCNSFPEDHASAFPEELRALMPRTVVFCVPHGEIEIGIAEIEDFDDVKFRPRAA